MKVLLSFAAAGLALLAGGATVQAQHGHGGHGGGHGGGHSFGHGGGHSFGHGGHYSGHGFGHAFGHYSGHGYHSGFGLSVGLGHGFGHGYHSGLYVQPYIGYSGSYWGGYPSTYGSSWSTPTYYYPSVVTSPAPAPASVVPASGVVTSTSYSYKPNVLPPSTGAGLTLRLPAEFPNSLHLQIDKREIELKPGTEVTLKDRALFYVEFDRGGDFGIARYDLTEGSYRMTIGAKGWSVVSDAVAPTTGTARRNDLPSAPPGENR